MRTKNFFKGLAVAAVALVGAFATSCSEENLSVNATGTELPDGKATAVITVVDLGDMGVGATVLATTTKDITNDNSSIQCPDFAGSDEYVIPAAQPVPTFTLSKGENLTIPFTFYVVKMTSVFADVTDEIIDAGKDPNYTSIEGLENDWYTDYIEPYAEITEISGLEDDNLKNESNYWVNRTYEYVVAQGFSSLADDAAARAAQTTEADILDAYAKNYLNDRWNALTEKTEVSEPICIYSWGYATGKLIRMYNKPTYAFTYGSTTKEYTYIMERGTKFIWTGVAAIPGHEHAYNHSHAHGGYENAGGSMSEAQ